MTASNSSILTINGGSPRFKFAVYQAGETLERKLQGTVDRIGMSGTNLTTNGEVRRRLDASDHKSAAIVLMDWLEEQHGFESVRAVGHRVVYGR